MKTKLVLFLFICMMSRGYAQNSTGKLSFSVKNSFTGRSVIANIILCSGNTKVTLITDQSGKAEFEALPGKYDIEVSSPLYHSQNSYYTIEKGENLNIAIMLDPGTIPMPMETPEGKAVVCGYIMDEITSQPVVGAKVKLSVSKAVATSDKNGFFKIESNVFTPANSDGDKPVKCGLTIVKCGYKKYLCSGLPLFEDNLILKLTLQKGKGLTENKYLHKIIDQDAFALEESQDISFDNLDTVSQNKNLKNSINKLYSCNVPAIIRLNTNGNNGPCVSCYGCISIVQLSLETYVIQGLDDEWIASWNDQSLFAGAVAYRTYGAYFALHPMNANYDLVAYPCKQNWNGMTTHTQTTNAASATAGEVIVNSSNHIPAAEYAAETNDSPNCGDGWSGDATHWPCISDAACYGSTFYGHHRGMCQWGSHRWAQQGKTYTWILDHYYNPGGYYRCTSTPASLDCSGAIPLICGVPYNGTTVGGNSNVSTNGCNTWADTGPEKVHVITTSSTGTITATLSNLGGADLDVYILGSCNNNDCHGTVTSNTATYTNAPAGTYYILVDGYLGASGPYTLTVSCPSTCTPVAVTTQPSDQTVMSGNTATFSVSVSGTPPFSYFWYENGVFQASTLNTSSASNTFTTAALTTGNNGQYYYCLINNCNNLSQDQSNYAYLTVNSMLPDLIVTNTSSNPISACPGEAISVGSYVHNTGIANAGASTMRYYLSQNSVYDGNDMLLGNSGVASIIAGGVSPQILTSLTIPGGTVPGSYYILFYADAPAGVITEGNENNNVAYRSFMVENCSSFPDLVITKSYFSLLSLCSGSEITLEYDIENIGGSMASASTVNYYLSSDNAYQAGDVLLGSTSIAGLNSGSNISVLKTLTIPSGTALGSWYVLIITDFDNVVNEGANGESNNVFSDIVQITSCSGLPDLIINYNTHTPTVISPGTLVHVNYIRENLSNINSPGHKIGIYISNDNIFDPDTDEFLNDWSKGSLAAGSSAASDLDFTIPDCYQCGTVYIFLVIDYLNIVNESNESNNYDSFQVQITGCVTCSYAILPTGMNFQSSGGSGNFNVTTNDCCEWTATTNDSWITITMGSDYGNGTVNYTVDTCSGGGIRTGAITVAGQTYTVTQNCTPTCNNSQSFYWAVQAESTGLSDEAVDLAMDAAGNLYMTGFIQGSVSFGGGITLTTPSPAPDVFVSKHNSSGVIQWAVNFGDTVQEKATAIATDNAGNVYVAGNSENYFAFTDPAFTINDTNEAIAFLIKLNSNGVFQWEKKINPGYFGRVNDIFIDHNNSIFVTGSLKDPLGSNGDGLFVVKYDVSGNKISSNTYGFGGYLKSAYGITVGDSGNIFVTGRYRQTMTIGTHTLNASASLDIDGFIAKIDSGGTIIWAKNLTSPGQGADVLMSVVVDNANNIYALGSVDSTAMVGGTSIPLSDGNKAIIIKFDQNGNVVWAKAAEKSSDVYAHGLLKGNDNNIYFTAYYSDTLQIDTVLIAGTQTGNASLICIDTSGSVLWAKGYSGNIFESANGLAANTNDDLFIAGGFKDTIVLGNTTLTSMSNTDIYLAKYKQCDLVSPSIINPGGVLCSGQPVTLSTEYCSSYDYQWKLTNADIPGANLPNYDATQSGSYNVLVSAFSGCEATSAAVNLSFGTIQPPIITGDNFICESNSTVTLNAGSGYSSYQWSNGDDTQIITVGTGTFSVTVSNSSGCSANSSIQVTFYQPPVVEAGRDTTIGHGESLVIGGDPTAFGPGPFVYNWIPSASLNNSTIPNPLAMPDTTTTYTVFVTNAEGCENYDTVVITVGPAGISDVNANSNISVYPNPTYEILYISVEGIKNGPIEICLTDILGQQIKKELLGISNSKIEIKIKMNIKELASGIYFLSVYSDSIKKIVKVQKL
ncbi:MAG TPA: CARDB domain-containing protein [Bacteroidales bacterium]|nr:CARDB domain-containing protein [Bacteroidales bacterium]